MINLFIYLKGTANPEMMEAKISKSSLAPLNL